MATKKAAPTAKSKTRRVTIPAGQDYALFGKNQTAYVVGKDGRMPQELMDKIGRHETQAYNNGYKKALDDMEKEQKGAVDNGCARPETTEELLQNILQRLSAQNPKNQNKVIGLLLSEVQQWKEYRLDNLQKQYDQMGDDLEAAKANYEGFTNVRNGGFDDLNFR